MPVIKKHQDLVDYTAQHAGSVEGLFVMALLNGLGITDEPAPGTLLSVSVIDAKTARVFIDTGLDITSYLPAGGFIRPGGIGYMQIGNDFKVS